MHLFPMPRQGAPDRPTMPSLMHTPMPASVQPFISDEEVEKRYNEIRERSGILTILGQEFKADRNDLKELSDLGRGAFGAVRKACFSKTNTLMAVKIIPLTNNPVGNKRTVMDMDVIMRAHKCRHIVKCYGCFVYESEVRICMEMMTMCLDKLLRKATKIPERIVGKITVSALLALKYLKDEVRIIHRDIKPSNILIDLNGTVKLCDFGISGRLIDSNRAATNTKGCTAYLAPERVGSTENYGIKADVWSLGIALMELATGKHPYDGCNTDFELLTKINNGPPPVLQPSAEYSVEFCTFLNHCLRKKPEERPDYQALLQDPFVVRSQNDNVNVAEWLNRVLSKE